MDKVQEHGNGAGKKQDFFGSRPPWALEAATVADTLSVDSGKGLGKQEAEQRLRKYGPNSLQRKKTRSAWRILIDQFRNLIVLLLASAACISMLSGQMLEGVSILVAMFINVVIGFATELKARRSMESLHEMTETTAKVLREGDLDQLPTRELVPGDVVLMEGGDLAPADLRLLEANRMQADESALTGESVPVDKHVDLLEPEAPLAERGNMLFKGTALTNGSGKGVVVATGMATEVGRISELTEESEELTPLEERLNVLGHRLVALTLVIALLVGLVGWFAGQQLFLIFETAVALAVAAIPEGLPIVATIALARGMWRMASKNALVNRLSAVETLGATSIICTDKTGTLTENRMTVTRLALAGATAPVEITLSTGEKDLSPEGISPSDKERILEMLTLGALCNNAHLDPEQDEEIGDPLEIALLQAAAGAGVERKQVLSEHPEEKEEAFNALSKMMATWHRDGDGYFVAVKGAPEEVLNASRRQRSPEGETEMSAEDRKAWRDVNRRMAGEGLRLVAVARKRSASLEENPYESLTLIGLVGLLDPPRKNVAAIIRELKEAGIRVVMVTGDQPMTALQIGKDLGLAEEGDVVVHGKDFVAPESLSSSRRETLLSTTIFARISPEQKLDLISLFQSDGSVVAMTGDGVNDAPALTRADIGVAMGRRGTQVAREAADIVLKDDAFSTIRLAVEQGRIIFNNIRKFIVFLLSGNVGAILVVSLAMLFGTTLPLLPLQILFLNMISDVFPALALGVGRGEGLVMRVPPRSPAEPVLTRRHWGFILLYGSLIAAGVLGAFWAALSPLALEPGRATSISFLTLAFARTWHVFNMRDFGSSPLLNDVTRNPFVWGAVGLSISLLLLAVYFPPLAAVLDLYRLSPDQWGLVLGLSLVPLAVIQVLKQFPFLDPGRKTKTEKS